MMANDWKPGDLARCRCLCPRAGRATYRGLEHLEAGAVYTVAQVEADFRGDTSLAFVEVSSSAPGGFYWAGRFDRVEPNA